MGALVLVRHGQTEWSKGRRHTGRTDVPLTGEGERQAAELRPLLAGRGIGRVITSPLSRAARTAELAGLTVTRTDPDLQEWDYGGYEGVTTAEIRRERPGWDLWRDGVIPGDGDHPGEKVEEVAARVDRVLAPLAAEVGEPGAADTVLVAHGHVLRVLTARWLGLDGRAGALFSLGTGAVCTLDREHDRPVVSSWNLVP
ncbi:histidine phosphatase family protein [Nocardiopsis sp. CC223A]|uniref:histidine phosphatase family protein n=1 Tax=Nocardiopsis sp. CC223A TaxID=3044051 RepID=UPI00278C4C04|nr:histidine phosphatase family protein [Nocardiopsis sp. CC223A]